MNVTTLRLASSRKKMLPINKTLRRRFIGRFGFQRKRPQLLRMALLSSRRSTTAEDDPATNASYGLQLDLLTGEYIDPKELKIKRRFVGKRNKRRKYAGKKMVQYKIPYWKGLKGERKRAHKGRCHETAGNDHDVFEMTSDGYTQFLVRILEYLPKEIAALGSRESNRIAEIVAWVDRRFTDDPFSFEECCRAAGVHPDNQRDNLRETLAELYADTFDHYRILRNNVIDAEAGAPRAVDWVLSTSDVSKSFNDCCRALGFNPKRARSEVLIPAHLIPVPQDESLDSTTIEQLPTATFVDENQTLFSFD